MSSVFMLWLQVPIKVLWCQGRCDGRRRIITMIYSNMELHSLFFKDVMEEEKNGKVNADRVNGRKILFMSCLCVRFGGIMRNVRHILNLLLRISLNSIRKCDKMKIRNVSFLIQQSQRYHNVIKSGFGLKPPNKSAQREINSTQQNGKNFGKLLLSIQFRNVPVFHTTKNKRKKCYNIENCLKTTNILPNYKTIKATTTEKSKLFHHKPQKLVKIFGRTLFCINKVISHSTCSAVFLNE